MRVDRFRRVLAEDAIDMAGLRDHHPVIELGAVHGGQRGAGRCRAVRLEGLVLVAMHEQRRHVEAPEVRVGQVVVGGVGADDMAGPRDMAEMQVGRDAGLAEHLRQRLEGCLVELVELVELRRLVALRLRSPGL